MSAESIDPAATARGTSVVEDNKITVVTECAYTDGSATTSFGTIRTTIQTTSTGATPTVSISTSNGATAPTDGTDCLKLQDYALDMAAHWVAVKQQLAELASSSSGNS